MTSERRTVHRPLLEQEGLDKMFVLTGGDHHPLDRARRSGNISDARAQRVQRDLHGRRLCATKRQDRPQLRAGWAGRSECSCGTCRSDVESDPAHHPQRVDTSRRTSTATSTRTSTPSRCSRRSRRPPFRISAPSQITLVLPRAIADCAQVGPGQRQHSARPVRQGCRPRDVARGDSGRGGPTHTDADSIHDGGRGHLRDAQAAYPGRCRREAGRRRELR